MHKKCFSYQDKKPGHRAMFLLLLFKTIMEWLSSLFGEGDNLNSLQMGVRAAVAFFAALALIRIAGLRTFGRRSAMDNVIIIMLGAVLSRAVVGASPFIPVLVACAVFVLIHRLLAWLSWHHDGLGKIIKGEHISLFANGKENIPNMKRAMISKKDMMEGVRLQASENSCDNIEEVFIERSGEISVVKK
jgi:uncharacterized membrane protein YcaP (DUF421 family)